LKILKEFEKALNEHLSLRNPPVAVKFLKRGEKLPANMGRPKRDLGERVRPCFGWHLARHQNLPVAMLEEDFAAACPASLFIFGLLKPIPSWIEGALAYRIYTVSKKAAATMEGHVPRLELNKFQGVAFAPVSKASFTPDVIMVFCNSKDAGRLVAASAWMTGEPIRNTMAGRALCAEAVIQPFQVGQPVVAIPCAGDRDFGRSQDDEIVFATPLNKLKEIITGLKAFKRTHQLGKLGEESEIRKKYNEMAGIVEKKLGRN